MSSRKSITCLPPEVLHTIFHKMDGKGIHDIDPTIFQAIEVCGVWRFIIYYVLFGIRPETGFTPGFDYYLYCRVAKLRQLQRQEARFYREIDLLDREASVTVSNLPVMGTVPTPDSERQKFIKQSEEERAAFTKETKLIFAFQASFGSRPNKVRGDSWNDWVWAHIVAARIQSDLREKEYKTKIQETEEKGRRRYAGLSRAEYVGGAGLD